MPDLNLYELYNRTKNDNISIQFKGALSQEILLLMGDLINANRNVNIEIRKIFSIFVELSQNIMHYSSETEMVNGKEIGIGIIIFTEDKNHYRIYSGNQITNESKNDLLVRFQEIQQFDDTQLKEQIREQRHNPQNPESRGAGIGLMEIARKASGNINVRFYEINQRKSFIELIVEIKKGSN
jgi:hypothetical protein